MSPVENINHKLMNYLEGYAICRRPFSGPRGCHLGSLVPPFWKPFSHLGATLEAHRRNKDTRGSGTRFCLFWGQLWVPISTSVWTLILGISICFRAFSSSLFAPIFRATFGRLGLLKPGFRIEGIATTIFSQKPFSMDCFFFDGGGLF